MQLLANLLVYLAIPIGLGRFLGSQKDEDGEPTMKWSTAGLIIGVACALVNAGFVASGIVFGYSFNLDAVLSPFLAGLVTGLLIGIPVGLITAYDMFKRFSFVDGWLLFFKIIIVL